MLFSTAAKHIILPNSLTVQLKTADSNDIAIDNILCHLNIYSDNGSYYTYSFIPTDSNGTISLTREQIITNTQLRHFYNDSLPLDLTPVKFEFMILDRNFLSSIIESIDSYLSTGLSFAQNELRERGLTEKQIAEYTPMIIQKNEQDKALNSFLKQNRNHTFDYSQDKSKITDLWTEERDYYYDLAMQP